MTRVETSVFIQMPVEEVFEYVIQPENLPEWAPGYLEATSTSEGSIRDDSTLRRAADFGGRRSESKHAVEGGTRVSIAEEVTASLFTKPAAWAFALIAGRNVPKYGFALKEHLEKSDRQGRVGAAQQLAGTDAASDR